MMTKLNGIPPEIKKSALVVAADKAILAQHGEDDGYFMADTPDWQQRFITQDMAAPYIGVPGFEFDNCDHRDGYSFHVLAASI